MRFSHHYLASRLFSSTSTSSLSQASPAFALTALYVFVSVLASISQHAGAQTPYISMGLEAKPIKKGVKQVLKQEAPKIMSMQPPDAFDFRSAPAAYPAHDGHLVLTGSADVWVPKNHYIELMPNATLPGFTPVALTVFENGLRTRVIGVERAQEIPIIRVDPPVGDCNRKRVLIIAFDAVGKARFVMQCVVRARLYGPAVTMNVLVKPETCTLSLENRDCLSAVYLYLDDLYLGRIGDTADTLALDIRRLLPGTYHFRMMAQNTDGVLLPEMRARFTVPASEKTISAQAPSATSELRPADMVQIAKPTPM